MLPDNNDDLYEKVKRLSELLWEGRATRPTVQQWLANFKGDCMCAGSEQKHALYLLSKFLYFGLNEVRELLRAMFQDLVRHPLSVGVRAGLTNKEDFYAIHQGFLNEVRGTRFLGLGNPAASGTHILYYFRQVNRLGLENFVSTHELFPSGLNDPSAEWQYPDVHRLIFIDDFCGTGTQAADIGRKYVPRLREVVEGSGFHVQVWYLTLLATTNGLNYLRELNLFDRVESVSELDESYRVFGPQSQFYISPPDGLTKGDAEQIARHYGNRLSPRNPLGYGNSQLLLGFHHNVPNNTIPIMWQERLDPPWHAIFPRATQ